MPDERISRFYFQKSFHCNLIDTLDAYYVGYIANIWLNFCYILKTENNLGTFVMIYYFVLFIYAFETLYLQTLIQSSYNK